MVKPKVLELTEAFRLALEKGFCLGEKHCFRMRCHTVLLKADGLSSAAAGVQTRMNHMSVNALIKRFKSEGINGLNTRSCRGRKHIMDCSDEEDVRRAIEQNRQSVSKARAAWDQASAKRQATRHSNVFYQHWLKILANKKTPKGGVPRRNSMFTKFILCH